MEKCKFCNAELTEGSTLCPACGKDNAEKKATPGKIALAVAVVVVLAAVIIALLVGNFGGGTEAPAETVPETVAATIPADGNPDDETCKGTYTVTDEEVLAAKETVVATAGGHPLTNGQLQVYYWIEVQSFLANYGGYLNYIGLDYTKPLDTQLCTMVDTGVTWQQFFLANALRSWQNNCALAAEAEKAGFQLPADYQVILESMEDSMETAAANAGFASVEEYLAFNVGVGADLDDYIYYNEMYYPSNLYYVQQCEQLQTSTESAEIKSYYEENKEKFEEQGITEDDKRVNVRHILVFPEGADNSNIRTETFDEAAWAVGEAEAQAILDSWLQGEKSEDSFAALANEKSQDPGSNTNGGLYTGISKGQMVAEFENWCFDETRKAGDHGIVRTELGFHIMYYVSSTPTWVYQATDELMMVKTEKMLSDIVAQYPLDVDYAAVKLGYVNMGGETEEAAESAEVVSEPQDLTVVWIAAASVAALAAVAVIFRKKEHE